MWTRRLSCLWTCAVHDRVSGVGNVDTSSVLFVDVWSACGV